MTFDPAQSRSEAVRRMSEALAAGGITGNDARFLVLDLLELTPTDLILHGAAPLGAAGAERLSEALHRRLAGEPVARIVGTWEFWGRAFDLSPETLVPRPDTETLVETALALQPGRDRPLRILDLGTGSGCILVALLGERPKAHGLGIDRSQPALAQALRNAVRNGVAERAAFVAADWTAGLTGAFDLVVSNPPYIASATIADLATEVRDHDPAAALDGGADGLDAYRAILQGLASGPVRLAPGGALVFEVGYDQADAVARLGRGAGLGPERIVEDLAGHARVVAFQPDHARSGVENP